MYFTIEILVNPFKILWIIGGPHTCVVWTLYITHNTNRGRPSGAGHSQSARLYRVVVVVTHCVLCCCCCLLTVCGDVVVHIGIVVAQWTLELCMSLCLHLTEASSVSVRRFLQSLLVPSILVVPSVLVVPVASFVLS